jgi:hypothetical protein
MTGEPQLQLVALSDIDEAVDSWGANCGPAALAGALGLQLADVRTSVSEAGKFRGYMTIAAMKAAITRADATIEMQWSRPPNGLLTQTDGSPIICCIQWGGPWSNVPRAAATYRHFICYRHGYFAGQGPGMVCDVNAPMGWLAASTWKNVLLPELIPKRGDGTWSIQWAAQVRR